MTTLITFLFVAGTCKWAIAPVIIAAGISALSSLAGMGVNAAQNKKNQTARERYLQRRRQEETDWYNRRYNEDPTQRADAVRLITAVSEENKRRDREIAGRAAMGGATDEAVAMQKAAGNQALADVVGAISADNTKRKDALDDRHHATMQGLDDTEFNMQQQEAARRAQNMQTAMASAGNLAAAIVGNSADDTAPTGAQETPVVDVGAPVDSGVKDSNTQLKDYKPQNIMDDIYTA